MTLRSFLQELRSKNIRVTLLDNELSIKAPKEALTEALILKIKERKQELLDYLKQQQRKENELIVPVEKAADYPVSDGQKRLWVIHQMDKDAVSYNLPHQIYLTGKYDIDLFKKAMKAVVDRHEILRTVIVQNEKEEVRQLVLEKDQFSYDTMYVDLQQYPNANEQAEKRIQEDIVIPFDLEQGPLFRAKLFKLADQQYLFYANIHHIISDGWSLSVLDRDIMTFYKAFKTNTVPELPELPIQYKDYSVWQLNQIDSKEFREHKAYWLSELSGHLPSIQLPFSNSRPPIKTHNGYLLETHIASDITSNFQKLCKDHGGTLYVGLLTVLNSLLHRYTLQDEFIIGSPFAGRENEQLQNQIGFYINTLALRTKVDTKDSFETLFSRVKEKTLKAQAHKQYPFDRLINELDVSRDVSRNPVFDILLVLNNIDNELKENIAISEDQINTIKGTDVKVSKVDIEFIFSEVGGCLSFKIVYNTDLFAQQDMERMMVHYKQLLSLLSANPESSLAMIDYLAPNELQKLASFNETFVDYDTEKSLLDLFEDKVQQLPDNIVVSYNDVNITMQELDKLSNQFAHYLQQEHRIDINDLVGIQLDRSEWMLISILGILKSGAAFVPIGTDYPEERVAYIRKDCKYKVCVDAEVLEIFKNTQQQYTTDPLHIQLTPDTIAYALYTSGSTGNPKGVLNHHAGLLNRLLWKRDYLNVDETAIILQKTPYTFDVSVWELLLPLITGCKLVFAKPDGHKDPVYLQEMIHDQQITIIHFVPSVLRLFIDVLEVSKSSSLQHLICSGEALSVQIVRDFQELLATCKIHNLYGPTEAAIDVTAIDVSNTSSETTEISIGVPVANCQIYIVNDALQLQPVGIPGELLIGGIQVSKGYINRPELNASSFIENPFKKGEKLYRTGDIAKWSDDGLLYYQGRADNQVKINGQRIELEEISYHLREKDSIKSACVLVKGDDISEKKLIAYIVSAHNETITELQAFLSSKLPAYMIPAAFVQVAEIPLTSNGKVDRKELLLLENSEIATGIAYVAPRNDIEIQLINIWKEVLQLDVLGIDDNYFAIGGDSMKSIKLIALINRRLDIATSISDLYANQTVRTFSELVTAFSDKDVQAIDNTVGYKEIASVRLMVEAEDKKNANTVLPSDYESIYPLVPIEEGMIYSSLLRPEEPVYYDKFVYALEVENYPQLVTAIESLMHRHPILRTVYYMNDFSQPVKVVLKSVEAPISKIDLTHLSASQQVQEIKSIRKNDLQNRLQFRGELLYDFKIIQLNDKDYYIVWSFHHSVLDGWSVAVFQQELSILLSKETKKELPKLPYSYMDYCALVLSRKNATKSYSYWRKVLDGYTRNKLPFNYTGAKINNDLGMRSVFDTIGSETVRNIEVLCKKNSVSFKSVCVAAYTYLMHILCSEKDVVAGVVSHDRPGFENSDKILGCFLNTLPIRVDFSNPKGTLSLIKFVNDYLIQSHQYEVHLSEISNFIEEKPSSGNPIFDTLLNYTHFHVMDEFDTATSITASGKEFYDIELAASDEMTNTLFDVEVNRKSDSIGLRIKYVPSLFTIEDAQDALRMYAKLLTEFSKGEDTTLSPVLAMTSEEIQEVLYDYNDTIVTQNRGELLHELFEDQVTKSPANIALRQDGKSMTYQELHHKSNQVANYLISLGIQPGNNVGVLTTRSFDMIVSLLGVLKAGGSYVPIDPKYPVQRQHYIIENSEVDYIVTNIANPPIVQVAVTATFVNIVDDVHVSKQKKEKPLVDIQDTQLAYTIYTSGSTGTPKGVMIEHHAIVNLIQWVNEEFGINEKDRLLFITSICFDLSVYDVFGILASGGSVVIAREEEVQSIAALKDLLRNEKITFWDSVPTTFNYLIDELEEEQSGYEQLSLRLVFMSGDWIPVQLPEKALTFFPNVKIISLGGATEGTVWSNYFPIISVNPDWSSIPYGKPIRNNFFYVLDDHMQPLPKGTVGELFIGGVGVATGYANNPEKTANSFVKDPFNDRLGGRVYKTGDLGRWMRDGNMEFIGRKDNQVKIRGFRVELGEIESLLTRYESIKEAIVNVFKDSNNQNQLCAYIVASDQFDKETVKSYLKEKLPGYMVPNHYMMLEELPLNSNGKIDRKALPTISDDTIELDKRFAEPLTELESTVTKIWKSILKVDEISVTDDLFEVGANSLSVGAFANRIHKEINFSLSLRDIFTYPTIRDISEFIATHKTVQFEAIKPIAPQNDYPLSASQRSIWILSQQVEANVAYNMKGANFFEGDLNVEALQYAFQTMIDRHESLRTVFKENSEGEVRQFILPEKETKVPISYIDVQHTEPSTKKLEDFVKGVFYTPFDLRKEPLIRATLWKVAEHKWLFAYVIHHIVGDAWSINILINELFTLYNSSIIGKENPLPPLSIQYKDYAFWQQEQLSGDQLQMHKNFWKNTFSGNIPILYFPEDHPRPKEKSFNGGEISKMIDLELAGKFRKQLLDQNSTLFSGILSVINILLYKHSGQRDIIIGSPVTVRDHFNLENQIGYYVNMIPFRTKFSGDHTFLEILRKNKETVLNAHEHQIYPFDMLIADLDLERDPGRNPLFEVTVTLNNQLPGDDTHSLSNLKVHPFLIAGKKTSQFDLSFDFFESGDNLLVKLEYNSDIFEFETAEKLVNQIELIMNSSIENPLNPIRDISISQLDNEHENSSEEFENSLADTLLNDLEL